ncbi:hypothetical protein AB0K48_28840 [Nonomuraea sp. NPDC055795]
MTAVLDDGPTLVTFRFLATARHELASDPDGVIARLVAEGVELWLRARVARRHCRQRSSAPGLSELR